MSEAAASCDLTGLSVSDTGSPITTYHQIGGRGTVYNTVLAVPSHLNSSSPTPGDAPWNSLEHVLIPPRLKGSQQGASVGEHVQGTDEIYFIYQGAGVLTTDGVPAPVSAGTLVIAPKGTRHSIENPSTGEPLAFLVVELHAPADGGLHLATELEELPRVEAPGLRAMIGTSEVALTTRGVDLSALFSAPFGKLTLIELPPSARIEEYDLPAQDENLFVVSGFASFFVPGVRIDSPESGGHRNVVVPWGVPRRIVNSSMRDPLRILSVRVHRQVVGVPRPRRSEGMVDALSSRQ
jgi:mannose-6-phosphate isomerase-like protein (cupin superfamily)